MDRVDLLEILAPGILATVQDSGRQGYRQIGVAPSGAADSYACRIGNLLVGNLESAAVVEITLMGFQTRFKHEAVVAVTGADLGACLNGAPITMWTAFRAAPGDILAVTAPVLGCRAYLAVGGGIGVPTVMGSRATNTGAGFGGLDGRALVAGDVLPGTRPQAHLHCVGRSIPAALRPTYTSAWILRVIPGPQADQFTPAGRALFFEAVYTASQKSDRTGVRLDGPALETQPGAPGSILSEGIMAGAIQVPGDGRPIILLNETVTGGYRKIAVVVSADLPLLGQVSPGDTVQFQETEIPTAVRRLRQVEAAVDWLRACWTD